MRVVKTPCTRIKHKITTTSPFIRKLIISNVSKQYLTLQPKSIYTFDILACTEKAYYKVSRATIRIRAAFSYLTNYLLFVHLMVDLWYYSAEMMMIFQHATSKAATAIS